MASETGRTKELPSRDGWYWFKESGNYDLMKVDDDEVYDFGDKEPTSIAYFANRGEWLGPLSPSDAEQLMELRKTTTRLLKALEMQEQRDSKPFRRMSQQDIKTAIRRAKDDVRAALNPSHLQKETQ